MSLAGQGVVVTGAAGGIGRALAARLVREGARVVVNDLDPERTVATAAEIGAYAVPGNGATEAGIAALVAAASEHLGQIDAWFANAGIVRGLGLDATEAEWAASWEVNTMAHVRAARLLVPGWLERGQGRFVVTASAAGLLTALGSATYSATKHGAVGFAEWLSATYRHRGISVHAICPQGVQTDMLANSGPMESLLVADGAVTPEEVAEATMTALREDRFLVLPHPQVADYYRGRAADTDRWLRGMNRLQRQLENEEEESR
ncbi:SDR family NAD(P)-dependent oxidoreductase [Nocardioides sp.]|uniref:SDR family NAD(P)-dependent oxidoreductase n=1 Tax=Nocardioides sp. TaxID=35761 RepID=UPI0039E3D99A